MKTLKIAALAALLTGLVGCGGGGGGGSTPAPTPLDLASVQGVWDTTALSGTALGSATKSARAVMLKDGTAWIFLLDGAANPSPVGLVKATVSASGTSFSGAAKRYLLADGSTTAVTVGGSLPSSTSLSLSTTQAGATDVAATLSPVARFAQAASQAAMTGSWSFQATEATSGGGTTVTSWTWNVDANGSLSGTNTRGCTFTGQVLKHAEAIAIYNVNIAETCGLQANTYTGVALQNSAGSLSTFGLVSGDSSKGTVVVAQKNVPI